MAFLRETVGSIKGYLILSALLSVFLSLARLLQSNGKPLLLIESLIGLGFGIAYLYLGVRFRRLISSSPRTIMATLIAGACYLALILLLSLVAGVWGSVLQGVIGLLIIWYLVRNVRRLSREVSVVTR